MGSGKTAAGRLAAKWLNMEFVDMDAVLVQRLGKSISQVFADEGEAYFREQERKLAIELSNKTGLVISTGGGVVLNPDNISDFSRSGVVVCQWVDSAVAYKRTKDSSQRPLLNGDDQKTRLEKLLRERETFYRSIPLQIDASTLTVEQQARENVDLYRNQANI